MEVPLPWERLLWSGRPVWPRAGGVHYYLTDFRLVRLDSGHPDSSDEIALHDIVEVHRHQSRLDRVLRTSTIDVRRRGRPGVATRPALLLHHVRRGAQLAALIDLAAGDSRTVLDREAAAATLAWQPRRAWADRSLPRVLALLAVLLVAVFGVAIGLHGTTAPVVYRADDAIYPGGEKRDRAAIVQFMRDEVMPWARTALAPIVHGSDRVRCETCHGRDAEARGWRMPGVAALPRPDVTGLGWELYNGDLDAQMRNAFYGYVAESDKQTKAAYMREVVMPGMARLLRRQPYDFTRPYDFNRQRAAIGCYHCHQVK